MKKVVVVLLTLCLGFGVVGCSGKLQTIERKGYSFEIRESWEIEEYEKNSIFYYPNGKKSDISFLHLYEADRSSFPYQSLEAQYDSIMNYWLNDEDFGEGSISTKHTNIVKSTIGGNAFVTADKVTVTAGYTEYARVLCFCPSSSMLVVLEFSSQNEKEFSKAKSDVDRIFKSVKIK